MPQRVGCIDAAGDRKLGQHRCHHVELARGVFEFPERRQECVERRYTRLQWAVLNWNVNAIALYDEVGGKPQTEWTTYRVSGPELTALAQG